MANEDYSRFCVPVVRNMDASARDTQRVYQTARMCQLAPFLNRGTSNWPFKYQITQQRSDK